MPINVNNNLLKTTAVLFTAKGNSLRCPLHESFVAGLVSWANDVIVPCIPASEVGYTVLYPCPDAVAKRVPLERRTPNRVCIVVNTTVIRKLITKRWCVTKQRI